MIRLLSIIGAASAYAVYGEMPAEPFAIEPLPANPGTEPDATQVPPAPGPMSGTLDAFALAQLARAAGFPEGDLAIAVAVALAESGGNPLAYNPEARAGAAPGKGSYGLWQIYLSAHPEFAGTDLYDPQTNANAAFSVYTAAHRTFGPWSTYNGGRYLAFLPDAVQGVNA